MKEKKPNIITGHTYKEYRDKYGKKFDDGKLKFIPIKEEDKLDDKKKYWKIEDEKLGFYEVGNNRPWFIPLIVVTSAAIATAVIVPSILLTRPKVDPQYCNFSFIGEHCTIEVDGQKYSEKVISLEKSTQPTTIYTINANEHFILPNTIDLPSFVTYDKVDNSKATVSFNNKIENDINMNIEAQIEDGYCIFDFNGVNCSLDDYKEVYRKDEELTFTLRPSSSFDLPANIVLKINGETKETSDYTYTIAPDAQSATIKFTITGNSYIGVTCSEKGLFLSFDITPTENNNELGFAFQVTEDCKRKENAIFVDFGDNEEHNKQKIVAPEKTNDSVINIIGYYEMIPSIPRPERRDETSRVHTYSNLNKTYTVKMYGDVNNICLAMPHPISQNRIYPWGNANDSIENVILYKDLPAINVTSTELLPGIYPDTYVCLGNNNLKNATLAEGSSKIPNGAFARSHGVKNIMLPDTTKTIGKTAFSCTMLDYIDIPDSVETIDYEAFLSFSTSSAVRQLKNGINLDVNKSNLKTIGERAFWCLGYEGELILPNKLITIGSKAFESALCSKIVIPSSVTSIGELAFSEWGLNKQQTIDLYGSSSQAEADTRFGGNSWREGIDALCTINYLG